MYFYFRRRVSRPTVGLSLKTRALVSVASIAIALTLVVLAMRVGRSPLVPVLWVVLIGVFWLVGALFPKLDRAVTTLLSAVTLVVLVTSVYMYFGEKPSIKTEVTYLSDVLLPGEKRFRKHIYDLSIVDPTFEQMPPGPRRSVVYMSNNVELLVPWEFVPSERCDLGQADVEQLSRSIHGDYDLTQREMRIPLNIGALSNQRITVGFPPTLFCLYSAKATDDISVSLKVLVSQDPMDQGPSALVRDVFKYTLTWSGRLPTKNWVRVDEALQTHTLH